MAPRFPAWLPRSLIVAGLLTLVIGTIDPLEGSIAVLVGLVLITLAAYLRRSRFRIGLSWSAVLVALGVAVMFLFSAFGGVGGTSGRSAWWALMILPYPIGWIVGVLESIRFVRERPAT